MSNVNSRFFYPMKTKYINRIMVEYDEENDIVHLDLNTMNNLGPIKEKHLRKASKSVHVATNDILAMLES